MSHKREFRRAAPTRRARSFKLDLEGLERRIALSTFTVSTEAELRAAIGVSDSNTSSSNTIDIVGSISLSDTTAGQLMIDNPTGIAKTLSIVGQGASPTATVLSGSSTWNTRILEVVDTGGASLTVKISDLEISGGHAHDGGALGGNAAVGGGLLIDGGQVTLSNAASRKQFGSGLGGRKRRGRR